MHLKGLSKVILLNLLGSAILAFGVRNVHALSKVTEGGALGLTLLIDYWTGLSPSVTNFVISVLCYFLGYRTHGKGFLICSAAAVAGFSAFYALFEILPPVYPDIAEMPLAASVVGALFVGVGVGICVRHGGAPNADDALAMALSKKTGIKIQWVYFISDISVLILSLSYIPARRIVYSLITVTLSGQLIGLIAKEKKA